MIRIRFTLLMILAWITSAQAYAQEGPAITFLAGDAARAAIVDESVEPYFSLLCLHEMEVKSGVAVEGDTPEAQRAFFAAHYAENTRDFSEDEQAVIAEVLSVVHAALAADYPRLAAVPWSFIKVTNAVEQGLPHTRGHSIVLPEGFLRQMVPMYRDHAERVLPMLVNLMIHEQMHVVQRLEPETFAPFYTEQWGLVQVDTIAYGEWLTQRQLINPDGVDVRWVQNVGTEAEPRYLQPNIIIERFDDRPSRMPQDFVMVAVELEQGGDGVWRPVVGADGRPSVTPLRSEAGYMAHYGTSGNVYHPNESLADLFATAVLYDRVFPADAIGADQRAAMDSALDPVRAMMRQSFGVDAGDAEGE
ncbi:MAG: hypothetical protein ACIAXF_03155 [Phycisphaerales bacterium JB063]